MADSTCPGCGSAFVPVSTRQIYCTVTCGKRVQTRRRLGIADPGLTGVCTWCESNFHRTDARRTLCSEICARFSELTRELYRKYGITKSQYREMHRRQNGLCAICRRPERTERNELLTVDHDHVTEHVRELLCSQCNRAIGLFGDDPAVIRRAAEYVQRNRQIRLVN